MKVASWVGWLSIACTCLSILPATCERYKIRRPRPPPQIYKKSWPMSPRISMGNTIHIGGNFPQKRPPYKPTNYRIRRPPVFNVLPTAWKTQVLPNSANNRASLPQRPPVKEFHSMNKVPEYSPEYRPESAAVPPAHRGNLDEDKGPIHTIPAPNLSPADKPYDLIKQNNHDSNPQNGLSHYSYNSNLPGTLSTNFGFGTIGTSIAPQRTVTSPTPTQYHYEVTETNEIDPKEYRTAQPAYFTPEFDVTRLTTVFTPDLQTNEVFLNRPPGPSTGLIGTNVQFGHSNAPMQTNLHSSLHVGFPGTAAQAPMAVEHQVPDLHVGHPAPAGPPLSATQLYDLLNSFPQQLTEQYTTGQQPQLQQHLLQQQLGQLFQPTGIASFSQPQMHSFNYDEQANKRQQQQVFVGQDYASGKVTADYNLEPEASVDIRANNVLRNEDIAFPTDAADQSENNIDYEEAANQRGQSTYFTKVGKDGSIATQFYTTLPSREAAEKLAALAAAGNVNSHLIGQLRKQQDSQQGDETMPANHKDGEYQAPGTTEDNDQQYDQRQQFAQRQQFYRQQQQQHSRQNQQSLSEEKRPLRIMVPDVKEYTEDLEQQSSGGNDNSNIEEDYDYEEEDTEAAEIQSTPAATGKSTYKYKPNIEYGTRLTSKTGK